MKTWEEFVVEANGAIASMGIIPGQKNDPFTSIKNEVEKLEAVYAHRDPMLKDYLINLNVTISRMEQRVSFLAGKS